jgi:hypothetical protein
VKHFRVFGSKCYIKREDDIMGKFDSRLEKGVLVGYSCTRKAYKCYNMRVYKVVENINVTIDAFHNFWLKVIEEAKDHQVYQDVMV